MWKKVEKMFHALHKVDMNACYALQKINLACPYTTTPPKNIKKPDGFLMFSGGRKMYHREEMN